MRCIAAALALGHALLAGSAASPVLTRLRPLDLTVSPWVFTPGADIGSTLARRASLEPEGHTVTLPAELESHSGAGSLTFVFHVEDAIWYERPVLSSELTIGDIGGGDEIFLNGERIGASSGMAIADTGLPRRHVLPSRLLRFGGRNELRIVIRGLGGTPVLRVRGPITLSALGPHEMWRRSASCRTELQALTQTLWRAEEEAIRPRTVRALWRAHRRLIVRLADAETALGAGQWGRARRLLDSTEDSLHGLDARLAQLRFDLRDRESERQRARLGQLTALLTSDERARGITVRTRSPGFGRFGLWLHDGTSHLERVSPVEVRGRGAMGWRLAVDTLFAAEVVDIGWTSKTTLVTGLRGDHPCDWAVTASLPFPGVMIEQRAGRDTAFDLEAPAASLAIHTLRRRPGGVEISAGARGHDGGALALLVTRRGEAESIWAVIPPEPFEQVDLVPRGSGMTRLTLRFPPGSSRRLVLAPLDGIGLRDTHTLTSADAEAAAALVVLAQEFPARVEEFYAVDETAGRVKVFDLFTPRALDPRRDLPEDRAVWFPPLVVFAAERGLGAELLSDDPISLRATAFEGPTLAARAPGGLAAYSLALPSLEGRFHLATEQSPDLQAMLNRHLTDLGAPTMPNGVDRTYKSRAQGYHAWALLSPENRRRLSENGQQMIPLTFDPAIWHAWTEPFSGMTTWHTYTIEGPGFDLYDQEWGNGLTLYALSLWMMVEDGAAQLQPHLEMLQRIWAWWPMTDDWAWMRSSNGFHGHGTGAGDCSCADFAGALGRARIMQAMGDSAGRDEAWLLAARSALSTVGRFALTPWARERGLLASTEVAVGFHEGEGFLAGDVTDYPWNVTSMISGNGVQPELFDLLMARVPERLQALEDEVLSANPTIFDGAADYGRATIYQGNSGYITLPHLCAQARLGTPDEQLRDWIALAEPNSHLWWQAPTTLAEIIGRDSGAWLLDWSAGRWLHGQVGEGGTVRLAFRASISPFRMRLHLEREPARVLLNGRPLSAWRWDARTRVLEAEANSRGEIEFTVEPR